MNHTSLLNFLADKIKAKTYLEIGVRSTAQNFDKINVPVKVGVDPAVDDPKVLKMTSDDFFTYIEGVQGKNGITKSFDLIFLDGLHHEDQVKRDFDNALQRLNDRGFVVLHDTVPENEEGARTPRGNVKRWWGDVYIHAMRLSEYDNIDFITYPFDEGCTIVWKDTSKKGAPVDNVIDWNFYMNNREKHMRFSQDINCI
jgi:hypothetical protein